MVLSLSLPSYVEEQVSPVTLHYLSFPVANTSIAYVRIVAMKPLLTYFDIRHVVATLKIAIVINGAEKIVKNLRCKALRICIIRRLDLCNLTPEKVGSENNNVRGIDASKSVPQVLACVPVGQMGAHIQALRRERHEVFYFLVLRGIESLQVQTKNSR